MALWLTCLLGALFWILRRTGQGEDETLLRTMLITFLLQGHTLYAFLTCFGLLQEDRPENAWWRTRPISPAQVFFAKLAVSMVTNLLPLAIALQGARLMGYSFSATELKVVVILISIFPCAIITLAFGLFSLLRNRAAALFAAILMGLVPVFAAPNSKPANALLVLLPVGLSCVVMLAGLGSGYLTLRHGRGLRAAWPFLSAYLFMFLSFVLLHRFV